MPNSIGSIPFPVVQELSKWCQTDGPFTRGRAPAENISLTLFGRSLPRLAGQNANVTVDPVKAANLYDEFCRNAGIPNYVPSKGQAMIQILRQSDRMPILEWPWAIIAMEEPNLKSNATVAGLNIESHVFLLSNGQIQKSACKKLTFRWEPPAHESVNPTDEAQKMAMGFIRSTIESWQIEEYQKYGAMHLLKAADLIPDEKFLTQLAARGIIAKELKKIYDHSENMELKAISEDLRAMKSIVIKEV